MRAVGGEGRKLSGQGTLERDGAVLAPARDPLRPQVRHAVGDRYIVGQVFDVGHVFDAVKLRSYLCKWRFTAQQASWYSVTARALRACAGILTPTIGRRRKPGGNDA